MCAECLFSRSSSMLQCVAASCSVLRCVAVCCSVSQCVAVCRSVLQCVAVSCSVLQCITACCSVLQCVAVCSCRSVSQCVAVCRSATHCNTRSTVACSSLSQYVLCTSRLFSFSCNMLQCVAMCCNVLQPVAVCCSVYLASILILLHFQSTRLCLFWNFSKNKTALQVFPPSKLGTGWQRPLRCLKLQVGFRKRATNYRALLREMTHTDKASYGSLPLCSYCVLHKYVPCVYSHSPAICCSVLQCVAMCCSLLLCVPCVYSHSPAVSEHVPLPLLPRRRHFLKFSKKSDL